MEAIAFFHLKIVKDPLQIEYEDSLKKLLESKWPPITYFDFDNHSGDEIFALASQLSEQSKNLILFIDCKIPQADGKIAGWLNFIIRQKANKFLFWRGVNALMDKMKVAFSHHHEISDYPELIKIMELKTINYS
jgi:hypothetical protein